MCWRESTGTGGGVLESASLRILLQVQFNPAADTHHKMLCADSAWEVPWGKVVYKPFWQSFVLACCFVLLSDRWEKELGCVPY